MESRARCIAPALLALACLAAPTLPSRAQDAPPDRPDLLVSATLPASGAHGEFELEVHVDSLQPFSFLLLQVRNDPADLEILGWRPGDSLASQIEENGEPPACDIIIYPDRSTLQSVMLFRGSYSTEDYGTSFHKIRYRVKAAESKTVTIRFTAIRLLRETGQKETFESSATISVEPPFRFLRGDANMDSQLNIADPLRLLDYLFQGESIAAMCDDAADANNDGDLRMDDALFTLQALFLGTANISLVCEPDTGTDVLTDCEPSACRSS